MLSHFSNRRAILQIRQGTWVFVFRRASEESDGFLTPVEGRKLVRNESESRKWVRHLRTRHSSSFYGCQGIIHLHPSFLPLFLLSASPPACFPWLRGKCNQRKELLCLSCLQRMGFNLADQSPLCLSLAFKVCTPTDCSENEPCVEIFCPQCR